MNTALPRSISLRQVYVEYTAAAVSTILTKGIVYYLNSIEDGELKLLSVLNYSEQHCPNEKWILAGYSQGALSVDQVSRYYTSSDHLAAVDLIADPERERTGAGQNLGSAGPHQGIYSIAFDLASPLPSEISSKTLSLCNRDDVVCDTSAPYYTALLPLLPFLVGGPISAPLAAALLKHGVDVHTEYKSRSLTQLDTIGAASAGRARRALGL